jgi:hypothetical protein
MSPIVEPLDLKCVAVGANLRLSDQDVLGHVLTLNPAKSSGDRFDNVLNESLAVFVDTAQSTKVLSGVYFMRLVEFGLTCNGNVEAN